MTTYGPLTPGDLEVGSLRVGNEPVETTVLPGKVVSAFLRLTVQKPWRGPAKLPT